MEIEKNPLISVIVPVYNVEKYLIKCIDSIKNQTYKHLEIILVDDGSTDQSGEICDELQKSDRRICVYHKSNGGLSDARNYGMEQSKGEFLSFIDSDDILHKDFYSVLIECYKRNHSDILSTVLIEYYTEAELYDLLKKEYNPKTVFFSAEQALREYFHPAGNRKIYHGLCVKIYKKALFEDLRFEKGRLHEDLYITYKLLDKCNSFTLLEYPYYFYNRENLSSICNTYGIKNFIDEMEAFKEIYEYFKWRENVADELMFFMLTAYQGLLIKSLKFKTTQYLLDVRKILSKWILENLKNCHDMELKRKMKLALSAKNLKLYGLIIGSKRALKKLFGKQVAI